ncbi:MAG: hypothetical protein QOF51_291 [Chloroflexota bacterium]|jgi:hypothetical protein|nr:hypothetical protein [Chloroflexota bacterium]
MNDTHLADAIAIRLEQFDPRHANLHRLLWQCWTVRDRADTLFTPVGIHDVCATLGFHPDFFGTFSDAQTLAAVQGVTALKEYRVAVAHPASGGALPAPMPLWQIVLAPPVQVRDGALRAQDLRVAPGPWTGPRFTDPGVELVVSVRQSPVR